MARRIVKHKQHEFTTAAGAGNYAAEEFCDRILQNPAVNKDSILVDVYSSRPAPYAPLMDDHVIIEWDEIEMQREPNKERRQSKWRRRTRWINTQMS